ncbi:MAG: ABC transporter ATP-binding protein [Ilumatobacteraceae bacterium]
MGALTMEGLRIEVEGVGHDIVDDISFTIEPGEVLGLVGESGSGKTTVGLAALAHSRKGARITNGVITVDGTEVLGLPEDALRKLRGKVVSYVPQDPGAALNPAMRIGRQIIEILEAHGYGSNDNERKARVVEVMSEVALPATPPFLKRYPHQLSGGQQQRVGLAMAFACRPAVIVLDEPTTGLDVSTQSHVLKTVRDLCQEHQVAALYVTHDLAVIANLADRVAVMYAGRIVEEGPVEAIFSNPAHPYTRYLVAAAPDMTGDRIMVGLAGRAPAPGLRPEGCFFANRCELVHAECRAQLPPLEVVGDDHRVRCTTPFAVPASIKQADQSPALVITPSENAALSLDDISCAYTGVEVVHNVTFDIQRGECVALVGESGSGKSTLSKSIGGLHREWTGVLKVSGHQLAQSSRDRSTAERLKIQYVFQNPYQSLNPRRTIGDSVARPLVIGGAGKAETRRAVGEMLERVSLTASYANKYPDQLSGGERQRAAIARALVSTPDVLICDEVTSALDVLVQAAIIDLLGDLQADLGLSMLFVTHNLPVVRSIATRVAVMADGKIVEFGAVEKILTNPEQEYTKRLLADTPVVPSYADAGEHT